MTNILFSSILSMMSALLVPQAAADQDGAHRAPRGHAYGLCEKLECTDDQRAALAEIRAETKRQTADERAQMKQVRQALQAERTSPSPDPETIASLKAQMKQLRAQMKQARAEAKTQIQAVLTPEQREALAKMKAKRKAHKGKKSKKGKKGKRGSEGEHAKGERGKAQAFAKGKRSPEAEVHAKGARGGKGKALAKGKAGAEGKGKAYAKGKRGAVRAAG